MILWKPFISKVSDLISSYNQVSDRVITSKHLARDACKAKYLTELRDLMLTWQICRPGLGTGPGFKCMSPDSIKKYKIHKDISIYKQ